MDGVVEVRGGRVRGVERERVWSFSGVPYASSPAGGRRWRPPEPPEPWAGIRECDGFGPVAPQAQGFMDQALGGDVPDASEDCLNLNVWTPGLDGAHRPVLVWVHGGSFMTGSGSSGLYRGGMLARGSDVVVVTINYRLGLLGFLSHPALAEPGQTWLDGRPWSGSGNWGLADQVAALTWVRDHIADFGGDPGNVTLFGESAGGMSVSCLLAVPDAVGLFHRAVIESGPPYTCSAEVAADRAERLAAHLGVPCTREGFASVPADLLVAAGTEYVDVSGGAEAGLLMTPVIDGGMLTVPPAEAVAAGSASSIPLLIGTTRDESAFFALGSPKLMNLTMDGLRHWMRRVTPDDDAAAGVVATVLAAREARGESVEPRDLWSAIATEVVFRVGTVRMADAHAAAAAPGWAPMPTCSPGSRRRSRACSDHATPSRSRSCSGRSNIRWSRRSRVGERTPSPCRRSCGPPGRRSPGPVSRPASCPAPAPSRGHRGTPYAVRRPCSAPGREPPDSSTRSMTHGRPSCWRSTA